MFVLCFACIVCVCVSERHFICGVTGSVFSCQCNKRQFECVDESMRLCVCMRVKASEQVITYVCPDSAGHQPFQLSVANTQLIYFLKPHF